MALVEERAGASRGESGSASEAERRAMIDSQLRVSGVNDPEVLAAFLAVPREDHVPAARRAVAYGDRAVPLGDGAVLAPALSHGRMLTTAQVEPRDRVLVIGRPGTYLAALVRTIAPDVTLAAPGDDLAALGTFSLVLVDGAIEQAPAAFAGLLGQDSRLVTGLIKRGVSRLGIGRCVAGRLALTTLEEAAFVLLPEFAAPRSWSF